jgi:hypothetical protein
MGAHSLSPSCPLSDFPEARALRVDPAEPPESHSIRPLPLNPGKAHPFTKANQPSDELNRLNKDEYLHAKVCVYV